MIDTGADITTLHPATITAMGITLSNYGSADKLAVEGVGGGADYGTEKAILHFKGYQRELVVGIGPLDQKKFTALLNRRAPSLLGMDFLGEMRLTVDYVGNQISIDGHAPDEINKLVNMRQTLPPDAYLRRRGQQREQTSRR